MRGSTMLYDYGQSEERCQMNLILWVIFGALAGWITSKLAGTNEEQGWVMNIVLGIVGAIVGGFVWGLITDGEFEIGFNIGSLLVAILGGLIVSYLARFLTRAT
jgi:uncharacterized membrane protein YeaQ/YmgE (transglycosylase-associated protein family)